jgi:two-component system, NarL family, sensor histidine kinase DesK
MTRSSAIGPDDAEDRHLTQFRRLAICAIIGFAILAPAIGQLGHTGVEPGVKWFLLGGSVAFAALTCFFIVVAGPPGDQPVPWIPLVVIVSLGIALFLVGKENWLAVLAVAAASCGRFSGTARPAMFGATACALAGLAVAIRTHPGFGGTLSDIVIAPLSAFFAYSAGRRLDMVSALRRTRAELARAAVAEERLRIARDLHDLLGHSLSLITLKAELAGRVISNDPDRAAREIAELEAVARQSLSDVREAVAGFRQPDLAGELVAARQMLDAAGITSKIDSIDTGSLPQDVDAALAWAVREGTTNVVRHSRATRVSILVSAGYAQVVAEISDNGPAAPDEAARLANPTLPGPAAGPGGRADLIRARPAFTGSGLAGLAERVRGLGGELAAGAVDGRGFLLRVVVPLSPQA